MIGIITMHGFLRVLLIHASACSPKIWLANLAGVIVEPLGSSKIVLMLDLQLEVRWVDIQG